MGENFENMENEYKLKDKKSSPIRKKEALNEETIQEM